MVTSVSTCSIQLTKRGSFFPQSTSRAQQNQIYNSIHEQPGVPSHCSNFLTLVTVRRFVTIISTTITRIFILHTTSTSDAFTRNKKETIELVARNTAPPCVQLWLDDWVCIGEVQERISNECAAINSSNIYSQLGRWG